MRKIDHRQYKLTQIKWKQPYVQANVRVKKGRRFNARLDRRLRK